MPSKDIKLLRDQLAQIIGENRRLANRLEERDRKDAELVLKLDRLMLERDAALAEADRLRRIIEEISYDKEAIKKILNYYDNSHTPPSRDTITQREINREKKEERRKSNPECRRGRHKGCKNTSISRPASRTVRHRPARCGSCGGTDLRVVRTTAKNVADIPLIPRMEVTCHVVDECECGSCGGTTVPETCLIKGTSLGPNLLKMAAGLWAGKMVHQETADLFSGLFGMVGCAKSTIQHAMDSVADLMEPEAGSIKDRMAAKTTPVHIDETGYPVQGKGCWIWGATDDDATAVVVSGSRGEAVLHEHFPFFDRPLTADGYRPYKNAFGTLQRCWAHILRESDRHVRATRMRSGVSETDCRDAEERHARLQLVYHQAKETGTATPGQCALLVERTLEIASSYPEQQAKTISAAAPDLFTFLRHPGMQPTNNPAEREIRYAVVNRKVRGQIGCTEGMRRFGVLLTCILTWRKRKLNLYQELDRILMPQT